MMGVYSANQAVMTMIAELCGGIAELIVCWLVYLPHWEATEDAGLKLAVFALTWSFTIRNTGATFFIEALLPLLQCARLRTHAAVRQLHVLSPQAPCGPIWSSIGGVTRI